MTEYSVAEQKHREALIGEIYELMEQLGISATEEE